MTIPLQLAEVGISSPINDEMQQLYKKSVVTMSKVEKKGKTTRKSIYLFHLSGENLMKEIGMTEPINKMKME